VNTIVDAREVWNNGVTRIWEDWAAFKGKRKTPVFRQPAGARCIRQVRWFDGQAWHSVDAPASLLPDGTGVVVYDEDHAGFTANCTMRWALSKSGNCHLRVFNADGSLRVRVYAPILDPMGSREKCSLTLPINFSLDGVAFGSIGSDGVRQFLCDICWQTGEVTRTLPVPLWTIY
jgi:hypothetical protein